MIHARNETTGLYQRHQTLELGTHGGFALVHRHLVEMPDQEQRRELLAQLHPIDPCLPLQWQHALHADLLEPRHQQRHVAVGIDEGQDV